MSSRVSPKPSAEQNGWEIGRVGFDLTDDGAATVDALVGRVEAACGVGGGAASSAGEGAAATAATAAAATGRKVHLRCTHGDEVADIPEGFTLLGSNAHTRVQLMRSDDR